MGDLLFKQTTKKDITDILHRVFNTLYASEELMADNNIALEEAKEYATLEEFYEFFNDRGIDIE